MALTELNEAHFSKEMLTIYHISLAMVRHKNVNTLLNEVLDILDQNLMAKRATLTLFHTKDDALIIEASKGLTAVEKARGRYKLGEGVTGEVGKTKRGVIIRDVRTEPRFLDRTLARINQDIAFVCVPVVKEGQLIGTISIDLDNKDEERLHRAASLLQITANLLADAVAQIRTQHEEKLQLRAENSRLQKELGNRYKPSSIIGNSGAMQRVYELISQASDTHAPVLIRGESGTGKELVARSIHYSGMRQGGPFSVLNTASIPEPLLEKEMLGTERDGQVIKQGLLELAHGGTLFIDEVAELAAPLQARLEHFLQHQTIVRVGGTQPVSINVRIITATSRHLEDYLEQGRFREGLYYRLNVFPIIVPPLRERKSDIIILADHFLEDYNRTYSRHVTRISTPAINMLMAYHWPGNVHELKNGIERAVLATTDDVIHGYNLPPSLQTSASTESSESSPVNDLTQAVETYERELIIEALKKHRGNAAAAARALNTTPRVLNYKFNKLAINLKDFKKFGASPR